MKGRDFLKGNEFIKNKIPKIPKIPRVLIIGSGLTGSLTCYHLRALMQKNVRIDVADMARGAGGRMSTTRFGTEERAAHRANTGAQYVSFFSPEAGELLKTVCASNGSAHDCPMTRVEDPLKRSTHFNLQPYESYVHFLPENGTNSVVKQFLYGGEPDEVCYESRLLQIAITQQEGTKQLLPIFDRGGPAPGSLYDVMILALPPKDIMKFFSNGSHANSHDPQSQADLHRRTNKGRSAPAPLPPGQQLVNLPFDVQRRLRRAEYIGRYSMAIWFDAAHVSFIERLCASWNSRPWASHQGGLRQSSKIIKYNSASDRGGAKGGGDIQPHDVIDAISPQGYCLVVQSTVDFWRRAGDRNKAHSALLAALEEVAGCRMPRARHWKLLNWRTSQVSHTAPSGGTEEEEEEEGVVTACGGHIVCTGDWCTESSFEGCNIAAVKAAEVAMDTLSAVTEQRLMESERLSNRSNIGMRDR